jgi:peptidoglycan/xylan/chitin deacetylase (PgdA/CDA1 family)
VILAYHRIAALSPDPGELCVSPQDFRSQMAYLRRHYRPMPLEELVANRVTPPERAVAVTLDDGYLDALEIASPILADCDVPATFFVTTGYLDAVGEFWWDTVTRILLSEHPVPPVLDFPSADARLPTATDEERAVARKTVTEQMVGMSLEERNSIVARLVEWSGAKLSPSPSYRPMLAHEVAELATRPGHAIGAHGVHHLFLPSQPFQVQTRETAESKVRLETLLQRPVTAFAYPYGAFDTGALERARAAGFRLAVTTMKGRVQAHADLMCLPRVEIKPRESARFDKVLQEAAR